MSVYVSVSQTFSCQGPPNFTNIQNHIVFLEQITNRLKMVQTSDNMCDEGVALGYIMQLKVKIKLAPLRRYFCESAENLNVFIYLKCEMLPIYSRTTL